MPNPTPDEAKRTEIRAAIDPITGDWFPEGEAEIHIRWLLDQLKERTDEIVELREDLGIDKHLQAELDASRARDAESLGNYLRTQIEWSSRTFGEGRRTIGLIKHIRKELEEIEQAPLDLVEWIDVIILALEGYWRAGGTPERVMEVLAAKQSKNLGREWPPASAEDEPNLHVRTVKESLSVQIQTKIDKFVSNDPISDSDKGSRIEAELSTAKEEIARVKKMLRGVIHEVDVSRRFQHVTEPHDCRICEARAALAQESEEKVK